MSKAVLDGFIFRTVKGPSEFAFHAILARDFMFDRSQGRRAFCNVQRNVKHSVHVHFHLNPVNTYGYVTHLVLERPIIKPKLPINGAFLSRKRPKMDRKMLKVDRKMLKMDRKMLKMDRKRPKMDRKRLKMDRNGLEMGGI